MPLQFPCNTQRTKFLLKETLEMHFGNHGKAIMKNDIRVIELSEE